MAYGHFDDASREYVITRPDTPLPWLNFIGEDDFFGLVTNTAGGYSFYRDARLRRLTRYRYNQIPFDMNGRYLFIKDGDTVWNPGWKPVKTPLDAYECRHGLGYSRLRGEKGGIACEVTFFVPPGETAEVWRVKVTNTGSAPKSIQLFSFIEFCLYDALNDMTNFQRTYSIGEVEVHGSAIYHKTEYRERRNHYVVFACSRQVQGFDTDRDAFVGLHNGLHEPAAVAEGACTGSIAHGWNPIGAHQLDLSLEPGQSEELSFVLGYCENAQEEKFIAPGQINRAPAEALLARYAEIAAVDVAFEKMAAAWGERLSAFQIETPSAIVNRMGNTWNQVQCMATFNLSRSASLFESGIGRGMGYRDSNQDLLGFVHMVPKRARQRVLDIAATQMSSGLCFHQYQPLTKKGNHEIGGGFMDDHLWLILSTCAYIKETGDYSILDECIGYADTEDKSGTLMDHLELSLRYTMENLGPHQLPLIGHADWNDCLNLNCFSTNPSESFQTASHHGDDRVAESLMIAGLFLCAARELKGLYLAQGKDAAAEYAQAEYDRMLEAVETHGWDGEWYLRAFDAHGNPVGSHTCDAGQIYIESQGWLVMGGAGAANGRAEKALASVHKHLFTENGCVLQQPAYPDYRLELGEVSSYPPGYKENAGIFCHNNPWIQLALMQQGQGERAFEYYLSICPAAKESKIETYRGEPYVYAQMIAGKDAATPGEAKNGWLTGTAAWTFLTISQGFAGVKPDYDALTVDPCVPADWKSFTVRRRFRDAAYTLKFRNPQGVNKGVVSVKVGGEVIPGNRIPMQPAGSACEVVVNMG
ncbi:MAG: glycosyl transferase [Verrucomicrobiota bacterium JB024]|nr:glycosyl transferase [Verrucomicrobiota bacterium JB024]